MLAAANRRDLRQLFYELEDFLRHFPSHPQARLLKDELSTALRYEEEEAGPPMARYVPLWLRLLQAALLSASLGIVLYLLYKLLRYLLGL